MINPAKIQVRFADLDVMGHVNNSVYLSYFEMARVHYFGELLGKDWNWMEDGVLLVKNEVEYIKPIVLNNEPIISIACDSIGSKSFTLSYEVKVKGVLTTIGKSTLVCFNSLKNSTQEIPEAMLSALNRLKKE